MNEPDVFDVAIVGVGPAGLAAGLYAARDRYKTLMLERLALPGGQILLTENIENYPGYPTISGPELIERMKTQVANFGAEIVANKGAAGLKRRDDCLIELNIEGEDTIYLAKSVILAPGSRYRLLGVPGETEMRQATRVSYCATCDGAFYRDKHVLAVGGGNTAVEDTVYLASRFTRKVTLIHRRREFRAQKVLVEELYRTAEQKDIEVRLPYVLDEIVPDAERKNIDHVVIRNVETDKTEQLRVDGVFVFVGMIPNTDWLRGSVEMDETGYIAADPATLKSSMPGVFVAGDCRQQAAMQLATACADGVVAAMMVREYLRDPGTWDHADLGECGQGW